MRQWRTRKLLPLFLLCGLAACGGGGGAEPEPEPEAARSPSGPAVFGDSDPHDWEGRAPWHYPVHGVDVSRYQGEIDWHRVRRSNISFAFLKATEGGDVLDPMFATNWARARAAGMPRGAYHYYYFCRAPEEQARWFITHVPRDPAALPPVLDVEWTHDSRTCRLRPAPAEVRDVMRRYLDAVGSRYGKRPVIYATVDFYADNELWKVTGYDFWLRSVAGHPAVTYLAQDWMFWQYTGTGIVPGIEGPADINAFVGSHADFARWAAR